jgi:hypothetical protein
LLCVFCGVLAAGSASAASNSHGSHASNGHGEKHFVGLFLGVLNAEESDMAWGLEYEYKWSLNWGGGLTYENASDAHHGDGITSTIANLYFHPKGNWRLGFGYGREEVNGHKEGLTRMGVAYEFHFAGMGIEPSLNIDRVDGETAEVFGLAAVWKF